MSQILKQYVASVTTTGYTSKTYDIKTGSIKLFESMLLKPDVVRHSPFAGTGISCSMYFYEKDIEIAKKSVHEALRLEVVKLKKEFDLMYKHFIHGNLH